MPPGNSHGLVLDTSVWINLLATGCPWRLLKAIGQAVLAPEPVVGEVKRDPVFNELFPSDQGHPLRAQDQVQVVQLNEIELDTFIKLVAAPASDALGDGEAAAIAVAVSRGATLCIDERKASRIVREQYPSLFVKRTVDLLCDPLVIHDLGDETARRCFEDATKLGRMHIPANFRSPWQR